jgi:hypothetical protein
MAGTINLPKRFALVCVNELKLGPSSGEEIPEPEVGMQKRLLVFPFAFAFIFLFFGMPKAVSGKVPTVKITIAGGELTKVIEITDQHILHISNIWAGEFLDRSKGTAKEPPGGLRRYEVSFYIKIADHDVRKWYVLYYYPNAVAKPGYLSTW